MIDSEETKIKRACEARDLSIKQMCELTDSVVYKTLLQQFSRGSRIPHVWIDEISHALEYPIGYFSKYSPSMSLTPDQDADDLARAAANLIDTAMNTAHLQALRRQSQIGTMDVLNWFRRTGGELIDYEAFRDSVDLFEVMTSEDNIPTPYSVGRDSLSSQWFEIDSNEHYTSRVSEFHPTLQEGIKRGRIEAQERPYTIVDVEWSGFVAGRWITQTYCRFTATVRLPRKQKLQLIHAELVPNSPRSNRESTGHDLIQPPTSRADDRQE